MLLRILKKTIKKNGYILITVPAYQFLFSTKDKVLKHFRRYNKKTLKKTIDEFTLVEMSYFNALLFIPIIAIILFNKILNINYIKRVETTPHPIINKIFFYIFSFEKIILKYLNFPFGLSIYALIKK